MQMVSDGQNLNNMLTKRPSVRQSRLFREKESGNTMKNLLGLSHLNWDVAKTQGAFNSPVYDHNKPSGYDKIVKVNKKIQQSAIAGIEDQNYDHSISRRTRHSADKRHRGSTGAGSRENTEVVNRTNPAVHNKDKNDDFNTQMRESNTNSSEFIIDRKRDYELSIQKSKSHQSLLSTRPW